MFPQIIEVLKVPIIVALVRWCELPPPALTLVNVRSALCHIGSSFCPRASVGAGDVRSDQHTRAARHKLPTVWRRGVVGAWPVARLRRATLAAHSRI